MNNRLQLHRHEEVFETRTLALDYISDMLKSKALFAEPCIVAYGDKQEPNIILAIGSVGDGTQKSGNRIFTIDSAKLEEDVAEMKQSVEDNVELVNNLKSKFETLIASCGFNADGTYIKDIDDDLLKKANSLNDAIKILSYALQELDKITTITTQNTETLELLSTQDSTNGTVIAGNVKISTYGELDPDFNDNIIIRMNDGIFASADLTYDDKTGVLKFAVSGKKADGTSGVKILEKELKLGLHEELISVAYNKENEKIILTLKDTNGQIVTKEVPASELVDEWEIFNAQDSAIYLTKERKLNGKDVLSADVIISDGANNILKKSTTTGGLFVKGTADNIKYKTNITVEQALDSISGNCENNLEAAKQYTDTKVNAEKDRATTAEQALQTSITNEVSRATSAEKELSDLISVINGDNETDGSIKKALKDAKAYTDIETERATAAEQALSGKIALINGNEAQEGSIKKALKDANTYTDSKVKEETDRAMAAEQAISQQISVINGNEAQEGSIKKALKDAKDYTDTELDAHIADANTKFQSLQNAIDAEVKRATIHGDDTNTLNMVVTQTSESGTTIIGNVRISDTRNNILIADQAGLYTTVSLDYNTAENALYFYNGIEDPKKIKLSEVSVLADSYYDAAQKKIVLVFETTGGVQKTLEIPVADLLSDWAIGRKPESAVILTKEDTGGTITLYGDVDVSTDSDNLLKKTNGTLKASNQSTAIMYSGTTSVKEKMDAMIADIQNNKAEAKNYTDTQVQAEKDRATAAEQAEATRAMGVETDLQNQITAEIARATKAESDETTRATNAEKALQASIDLNKSSIDLLNADKDTPGSFKHGDYLVSENMKKLINDEATRAQDAESNLQSQIDKLNGSGSGSMADFLQQAKDYTDNAVAPIPGQIEAAKQEAINTAATDATNKANTAKQEAIAEAAEDATNKAEQALADAKLDATAKANQAKEDAVEIAAQDATNKANQALADAKQYTDNNHIYVTGVTASLDGYLLTFKFKDSSLNFQVDLTEMIQRAIAEAVSQAVTQASQGITYAGLDSDSCHVTVDNNAYPRTIKVDVYRIDNGLFA